MLSGRAMQPMQKAVGIWTRFQTISLARDRLRKIFDLRPEAPMGLPQLPPVRGGVVLDDIAFKFSDDGPEIFHNVNLRVKPGEAVGICGGNASGKSTLLYLIMGAMQPYHGQGVSRRP